MTVDVSLWLLFVVSEREKTQCERHRESTQASTSGIFSFFRPRPAVGQYVPQCDEHGAYEPTQCHTSIAQCWCVDANGQEIPNTRTGPGSTPLCESTQSSLEWSDRLHSSSTSILWTIKYLNNKLFSPTQVLTRQWLLPRWVRHRGPTFTPSPREHTCCSLRAGRSNTSLWTDTTLKTRRPNLCCTSL